MRNYTTTISPEKSVMLIEKRLVDIGAVSISKVYQNKELIGLTFNIPYKEQVFPVKLPIKVNNIEKILLKGKKRPNREKIREQAIRTAWKNLYELIDIQCSAIESEQEDFLEMFLARVIKDFDNKGNAITFFDEFVNEKKLSSTNN